MYTASNSAEKKNRPREGVAEGGCGGNSATPERIQKTDSPAVLLVKSRTPHKSFLFLLEEKNRRAQIKKCEENFFAGWRGFRATVGLASLLGVLLKKCSNFVQKTPPQLTELRCLRSCWVWFLWVDIVEFTNCLKVLSFEWLCYGRSRTPWLRHS